MNMMNRWNERRSNGSGTMQQRMSELGESSPGVFQPVMELQSEMNRIFRNFFEDSPVRRDFGSNDVFYPRLDVTESAEGIRITVDMPGMSEKDIELTVSDHTLMISGERRSEEESKDQNVYRRERSYGMFRRAVPLPETIDMEKIDARCDQGVLTINLPKNKEARKNWRKINVKSGKTSRSGKSS